MLGKEVETMILGETKFKLISTILPRCVFHQLTQITTTCVALALNRSLPFRMASLALASLPRSGLHCWRR